jgi:hypothetical protein
MINVNIPSSLLILDVTEYNLLYEQAARKLKRSSDPDKIIKRAFPAAARKTAAWLADQFTNFVMKDPNISQVLKDNQLRGALGLRQGLDIKANIFRKSKAFFKVQLVSAANSSYEVRFVNENAMTDVAKNIYYISKRSFASPFSSKRVQNPMKQKITWFEWLLRPSTGKIQGYSVWPGLGGNKNISAKLGEKQNLPPEFIKQQLESSIQSRSRSGTHTMLFGGSFSVKNWVNRKNDINIDKEFLIKSAQDAKDYFRIALIEQVEKQGVSRNVTRASGGAALEMIAAKTGGVDEVGALKQEAAAKQLNDIFRKVVASGDVKAIAGFLMKFKEFGIAPPGQKR